MKDINSNMKTLMEILESRELRAKKQIELLTRYPYTLISFTLNTPGPIKSSGLYTNIHKAGIQHLMKVLQDMDVNIVHMETIEKNTGREGFISVDLDPYQAKKIAAEIEDTHDLGRIFDIDVFDQLHNQLNRASIQLKPRKCLLCDEEALVCMKMKTHTYEELIEKVEEIGNSYFSPTSKEKKENFKSKISMSERVYQRIKSDILENKLKPGEKLVEENLANEFNVSRTPVREALKQLDQDGLITYYPRRGSVVSQISMKDAQELYEIREVLEGLAIRRICMEINSHNIKILETIITNMDKAIESNDYSTMEKLHRDWTEATLEMTNNELLKSYLLSVTKNLGRLRKISLYRPVQSIDAYKETKDIYNAIANNDPDESERLAKLHVKNARKRFEKNLLEL
ncbi:apo-citrate lyase phosphoribosyl-dephospho-CoA transferase [bioreactor metagenome]|jgi:holo-ACP synthase|uniref:citrate lyase holo-[acyl-carrier protein] synthase n=2 Tax=root TaxID=1 RepID=A0A562JB33_9FIRM|nr:citrate lyase holo-[acyl-carrier protein] synthase [Sedimentibacter saalensis]MEA5094235.1 citrate lyase holo-[acyl-carrier protein] synthase [Sedimentibacter saalensis]TWH80337.1 holo-ACP synthase CitX [Sedimentibacter saalensis]